MVSNSEQLAKPTGKVTTVEEFSSLEMCRCGLRSNDLLPGE
jgi:hypothetical protein